MTTVVAELEVQELVRFFEPADIRGTGGTPTDGRSIQELAGRTVGSIAVALQIFKVIEGKVFLEGREEAVPVSSEEFDHSPKYYFDAEVFPFAEVQEHYNWLSEGVAHPEWGVLTCFDHWAFERERPEIIKRSIAGSAEGG